MVDIIFLGSGGAFADFRINYNNNVLVDTDIGPVMIDCGVTAVQSLKELSRHPTDIAAVIVTHIHSDHTGGLEQLVWERTYTGSKGPAWAQTPIYTHPKLISAIQRQLEGITEYTDSTGVVRDDGLQKLVRITTLPMYIGGVKFTFHATSHVRSAETNAKGEPVIDKSCFGVLIERGGVSVYFTSDTTFNPNLGFQFPTSFILHDCYFGPTYKGQVHTAYSELCTLTEDVRGRTILMHHTKVPDDVDIEHDGFLHAATRHIGFAFREEGLGIVQF